MSRLDSHSCSGLFGLFPIKLPVLAAQPWKLKHVDQTAPDPTELLWLGAVKVGAVDVILNLTRSTTMSKISPLVICLGVRCVPMQSLCCEDLGLHVSHQDRLDVVAVELGPRHGTCTVQLYSTVQYSTVHYNFHWSQGTSKPFPSSSIERHFIF